MRGRDGRVWYRRRIDIYRSQFGTLYHAEAIVIVCDHVRGGGGRGEKCIADMVYFGWFGYRGMVLDERRVNGFAYKWSSDAS